MKSGILDRGNNETIERMRRLETYDKFKAVLRKMRSNKNARSTMVSSRPEVKVCKMHNVVPAGFELDSPMDSTHEKNDENINSEIEEFLLCPFEMNELRYPVNQFTRSPPLDFDDTIIVDGCCWEEDCHNKVEKNVWMLNVFSIFLNMFFMIFSDEI